MLAVHVEKQWCTHPPMRGEDVDPYYVSLTDGISGAAGFTGPHRIDHVDGGGGDMRGGAWNVAARGGGGIFVVAAFDALA